MFKAFFERRRLKKTLARAVLEGTLTASSQSHTERCLDVALIAITARDAAHYSEAAATVTEIADHHDGIVNSLLPVVIVSFGSLHPAPAGGRQALVASVQSRLTNAVAIVHGYIVANVGTFGGNSRYE